MASTDFAKQNAGLCEPADGLKHAQQFRLNAPSASGWALGFLRVRLSGPSGITQKELKVSFLVMKGSPVRMGMCPKQMAGLQQHLLLYTPTNLELQ